MPRSLLRAPLRFRRTTVRPSPVLCWRGYSTSTKPEAPSGLPVRKVIPKKARTIAMDPFSIELEMPTGTLSKTYYELRDACKCPRCVDVHSKQRKFRYSDIPRNIQAKTVEWNGGILEVTWQHDIRGFDSSHVSRYTESELSLSDIPRPSSAFGTKRRRLHWNKVIMTELQHWISYEDYMNDDIKFTKAMRHLAMMGLIFLKDIPDSREMVEKIATRMGPLRNTFYGPTWDVRKVPEAKNVAYTNQFLGFHMDLLYMKDPPGFQLLHCLRNSCDGGESLFADAFKVANFLRAQEPEIFKVLTKTVLPYEYIHKDNCYNNNLRVFDLGQNSAPTSPLEYVNYSPPFQGPGFVKSSDNVLRRIERQQAEIAALKRFAASLQHESNVFELKLKPGECVIFENRRVVHARRQFNTTSGERWLAGAYVDEDAVRSCWRVLREAHSSVWDNFRDGRLRDIKAQMRASLSVEDPKQYQETVEGQEGQNASSSP